MTAVIRTHPRKGLSHRLHAGGLAHPAQERFVPDAHAHDIEAAQIEVLPPVEGGGSIQEVTSHTNLNGKQVAKVAAGDEALQGSVHPECHWRRHDLHHEVRVSLSRVVHLPGFRGIHGHARFAQHVLPGCQRRERCLAVKVRPGADDDGVGIRRFDELVPMRIGGRYTKLLRRAVTGFRAAIADADDLYALNGLQAGDMSVACVRARPDNADTNRF